MKYTCIIRGVAYHYNTLFGIAEHILCSGSTDCIVYSNYSTCSVRTERMDCIDDVRRAYRIGHANLFGV